MKSRKVCIKTRSPLASLSFKGKVTKYTTVKWTIAELNNILIFLLFHTYKQKLCAHLTPQRQFYAVTYFKIAEIRNATL